MVAVAAAPAGISGSLAQIPNRALFDTLDRIALNLDKHEPHEIGVLTPYACQSGASNAVYLYR